MQRGAPIRVFKYIVVSSLLSRAIDSDGYHIAEQFSAIWLLFILPSHKMLISLLVDPLQVLPAEITTIILSNLDAPSLIQAELVSKHWHDLATSPHVWKDVFLRRFEPTVHVSPVPIQMGGIGVGNFTKNGKHAPAQNWKAMYKTRKTIDRRWKSSNPSAIYLNGHTDSVYCCQFDEKKIITGSRDRTIRVWDMNTYECIKVIGGPTHRPVSNTPPAMDVHHNKVVNNPSLNGTQRGNEMYVH